MKLLVAISAFLPVLVVARYRYYHGGYDEGIAKDLRVSVLNNILENQAFEPPCPGGVHYVEGALIRSDISDIPETVVRKRRSDSDGGDGKDGGSSEGAGAHAGVGVLGVLLKPVTDLLGVLTNGIAVPRTKRCADQKCVDYETPYEITVPQGYYHGGYDGRIAKDLRVSVLNNILENQPFEPACPGGVHYLEGALICSDISDIPETVVRKRRSDSDKGDGKEGGDSAGAGAHADATAGVGVLGVVLKPVTDLLGVLTNGIAIHRKKRCADQKCVDNETPYEITVPQGYYHGGYDGGIAKDLRVSVLNNILENQPFKPACPGGVHYVEGALICSDISDIPETVVRKRRSDSDGGDVKKGGDGLGKILTFALGLVPVDTVVHGIPVLGAPIGNVVSNIKETIAGVGVQVDSIVGTGVDITKGIGHEGLRKRFITDQESINYGTPLN